MPSILRTRLITRIRTRLSEIRILELWAEQTGRQGKFSLVRTSSSSMAMHWVAGVTHSWVAPAAVRDELRRHVETPGLEIPGNKYGKGSEVWSTGDGLLEQSSPPQLPHGGRGLLKIAAFPTRRKTT